MKIGEFTEQDVLALARRAYNEGRADFEIVPQKCALLVIDMQDEFVKPHWSPDWVPEATRQVLRVKKVIEHCRKKDIPVIYTVYSKTHQYLDRPLTGKFMPGRYSELEIDFSQFYIDDRGEDFENRGARIVFDDELKEEASSTDMKQKAEFGQLIEHIRDIGFNPTHRMHINDFDLNHKDSFQTLTKDVSKEKGE